MGTATDASKHDDGMRVDYYMSGQREVHRISSLLQEDAALSVFPLHSITSRSASSGSRQKEEKRKPASS